MKTSCPLRVLLFFLSCLALFLGPAPAHAQAGANVTIAPTRLVFEGRERSQELVLVNRGQEAVTYRIAVIGMHMNEEGRFERVEEPQDGQLFAHELIRFAPRQVTLDPGATQRVRVMVRKPAALAEGEYRSHLLFQAVPKARAPVAADAAGGEGVSLQFNIVSGISIATIVRHGDLQSSVAIDDLALERPETAGPMTLKLKISRKGERSVYGDFFVHFVAPGSTAPVLVGQAKGVAVYTPNARRLYQLGVQPPEDVDLSRGRLVVTYKQRGEEGGAVIASGELVLP